MWIGILVACVSEKTENQVIDTAGDTEEQVEDSAEDTEDIEYQDLDGDGYPDWRTTNDWEIADCDDSDPLVTPNSERFISEGSFIRGGNVPFAQPQSEIYLSNYCMDVYEVTNQDFVEFLVYQNERGYFNQTDDGQKLFDFEDSDDDIPERIQMENGFSVMNGYQTHPVVEVWQWSSQAFCQWKGKKLPTEAEWEKGARGPEGNRFPWGINEPTCDIANFGTMQSQCTGGTVDVGSYPEGASYYGLMDMGGNIAEFVQDWFQADYYSNAPTENPQGPDEGYFDDGNGNSFIAIIARSGNFATGAENLQTFSRQPEPYDATSNGVGFRCARELSP